LAERNEALDAERTTAQARVADLSAQLATTTRTAESASERVDDLELRLDAAVVQRDTSSAHAKGLAEQLERAVSDADQLRTHAASIGDELAATSLALEEVRFELAEVRVELEVARRPVDVVSVGEDAASAPLEAASDAAKTGTAALDAAVASALAETTDTRPRRPLPEDGPHIAGAAPTRKYRTVPSKIERKRGGPEVEREAALVREIAPVDPEPATAAADETDQVPDDESPAEIPTWRRTAMAELTALASDDITPRRRR
jgi:hypothetical protein